MEITIAIPVYNTEHYIEKCLLSALAQDFSLSFEILVIEDKSEDQSLSIIREISQKHPRGHLIRLIELEQHLSIGQVRNIAIEQTKGKYLFFLDADDYITTNTLSHLYALSLRDSSDVVVGSTYEIKNLREQPRYTLRDITIRHESAGVYMGTKDIFMNIEVWNKLFRTDFLRSSKIKCVHPIFEDSIFDFCVRAESTVITLSSQLTYFYVIRKDSIMSSITDKKISDEAVSIYCDIIKKVQELIKQKYGHIYGIFDLYCLRLAYSFYSIKKNQATHEQELYLTQTIADFLPFIPGFHSLKSGTNRLAWLKCKLSGSTWQSFEKAYRQRFKKTNKITALFLQLL